MLRQHFHIPKAFNEIFLQSKPKALSLKLVFHIYLTINFQFQFNTSNLCINNMKKNGSDTVINMMYRPKTIMTN